MCEYCNDRWPRREGVRTSDGHVVKLSAENNLVTTLHYDGWEDYVFVDINNCPWCGRELEDKK
ncbi:hypothetical protein SH48_13860 [Listeria monocytogenes]|nr:hypothetical protein [Listeria monocytogenes]EAD1733373.1 hypothetical protein [Listeria monocytogenes]EAD3693073.1 hypothetical protein [Listeria monocytogenes]EAD8761114.1 hypothetical protein [Listeria monocytogenes]EAE2062314.1 hypothetical protein [Listeria monocytogenes]